MNRRAIAAACALALFAGTAAADESRAKDADHLFSEGRSLVLAGRFADGCPKLEESFRIEPGIGTALWLGECYEKSGRPAQAWSTFKRAAALARAKDDDRRGVAEKRAAILEASLPHLQIVPPPTAEDLVILRDGRVVEAAELGVPIPIEPGPHLILATARGMERWSARVDIAEGSRTTPIVIALTAIETASAAPAEAPTPPQAPAAAPAREPSASSTSPSSPSSPSPPSSPSSPLRFAALGGGALGLAGVGVGIVYGLAASASYDASNETGRCTGNACNDDGKRLREEAYAEAGVSTLAFTTGAIALASAVILWLASSPREPKKAAMRVGVTSTLVW